MKKKENILYKCEKEKEAVKLMIWIYCHKKHKDEEKNEDGLCRSCMELQQYAAQRTDRCPFMETKTFCSNCKVHCYKPQMREKIREVMRFSGPRMLLHDPVMAVGHACSVLKEKREKREFSKKEK